MLSGIVPGLGLMNYILGWFTVPIEVFLRRDFGERYFTKANFFAGLIVLLVFRFASSLFSLFNPLTFLFGNSDASAGSWLGSVIKYYIYLSIGHFLYIWWKDITGQPSHSFSSGRSWLRPIGRAIMSIMNLFLNGIVRFIFNFIPNADPAKREAALPVLRDVDVFTERFVEPFTVFVLALMCQSAGQTSMFFWLFFSVLALNFSTSARHQAERSYVLDLRDQMYDMSILQAITRGEDPPGSERMERFIRETAREAERTPEIIDAIRDKHPGVADAVSAINPKLKESMMRGMKPDPNTQPSTDNGFTPQF